MSDIEAIQVPVNWLPRHYQMPLWSFLEKGMLKQKGGGNRAVVLWHRRAGKDLTALQWTVWSAFTRPGLYWHLLPTYNQGRKIVWDGITKDGKKFTDAWPAQGIKAMNNAEMKIELTNGSMWQVVGTDNVDRLVGSNPIGCVFSEYSLQDPRAWEYIRPILAENGGWALFIYTPRGRNHGYELYEMARGNPKWFSQILTNNETHAISDDAIQDERDAGMPEEIVQQEFYCSFDAAMHGSYYGRPMEVALAEGRITRVPYQAEAPVYTAWDLGYHDPTAIWFYQLIGREIHIIDYFDSSGESIPYYAKVINGKEYTYERHFGPHDLQVHELGSGKTRLEVAASLGLKFTVLPKLSVEDGIEAVRNILNRCWFDEEKCKRGIESLRQYKKEWDDRQKCFRSKPDHDWASNGADAFRYLALSVRKQKKLNTDFQKKALSAYNPFDTLRQNSDMRSNHGMGNFGRDRNGSSGSSNL